MRIAILGGGFAGLSAAFYLKKKGHEVILFEREKLLGGLAVGFKQPNWEWSLERAYHHLFTTDQAMLDLAKDTNFDGIFYQLPNTESLYKVDGKYRSYPVDTPQDFLKFPLLSFPERIRTAIVLAFLKFGPSLSLYNKLSSEELFTKTMGKKAWETLFGESMRKKFGKYAGNILAMFIWARVKVRSKSLGYIKGGFQAWVEHLEKVNNQIGVVIKKGQEVVAISKKAEEYIIEYKNEQGTVVKDTFDIVISTLPSPILSRMTGPLFPVSYFDKFKKLKYLNAVVLILESTKPLLEKTYWLSICTPDIPTMVVCQHTNFVDKKYYGNKHIAYVGWYPSSDDPIWSMTDKEVVDFIGPHFEKINPEFKVKEAKPYIFKAPFAQPVFDKDFVDNKPTFQTPLKNFYIANLDMTYPNDRGTNYAVKLGKEVSELISNS